ncbi:unnamed protein product [Withania somnifera]
MAKKSSRVLQKVSNLLNMSIFLAKMRKPIITKLISLKKTKKFSLLKHYNYGYVQEYEFSPSNTPLLQHYNRKKSFTKHTDFSSSVLFISKCLGIEKCEEEKERRRYPVLELEGLAAMENVREVSEDNDDSIDERAEKFIERFYEEIKLQRQKSLLEQFNAMVDN